jgi:hypothetical protein
MDNTGTRRPELNTILLRRRFQEVKDLLIALYRLRQIDIGAFFPLSMVSFGETFQNTAWGVLTTIMWSPVKSQYPSQTRSLYKSPRTVYASRHSRLPQTTAHKLQQRHLCTRILHSNTIRLQLEIRLAPDIPPIVRVA